MSTPPRNPATPSPPSNHNNHPAIPIDTDTDTDEELTAYALNDPDALTPERRAAIETQLANDPSTRTQVDHDQQIAAALTDAFAHEQETNSASNTAKAQLTDAQRHAITTLASAGATPWYRSRPWLGSIAAMLILGVGTALYLSPLNQPRRTAQQMGNSYAYTDTSADDLAPAPPAEQVGEKHVIDSLSADRGKRNESDARFTQSLEQDLAEEPGRPATTPVPAPAPAIARQTIALGDAPVTPADREIKLDHNFGLRNQPRTHEKLGIAKSEAEQVASASTAGSSKPQIVTQTTPTTADWYADKDANKVARTRDLARAMPSATLAPSTPKARQAADQVVSQYYFPGETPPSRPTEPARANNEAYDAITDNAFMAVAQQPLSTFSIDVDTASYANVRRFLTQGQRPPRHAVRIEEMVNYFDYQLTAPGDDATPFNTEVEIASCPWQPDHRLVKIGVKGYEIPAENRPASNIVFLIDVSGSMSSPDKLPLLKTGYRMLVDQLREGDRVAIVVYAGASGMVLDSTDASNKQVILTALDRLNAGGSTNGGAGIQLAYDVATKNFITDGINRVILATDGDFNVGITDRNALVELVKQRAASNVYLTILGFGQGNLKDATMEQLTNHGDGTYAYIDSLREAQRVLVDQAGSTLQAIAKDVKIQVEFNPQQVASYRLIGYENRILAKEDFDNDTVDAGDIGAGHSVVALYEVVPVGTAIANPVIPTRPMRYQQSPTDTQPEPETQNRIINDEHANELLAVNIRYKAPDAPKEQGTSKLLVFPVQDRDRTFDQASSDFKFAAAVASFGMILRDSPHVGNANLALVETWAKQGLTPTTSPIANHENAARVSADQPNDRAEFITLVQHAHSIMPPTPPTFPQ